MESIILIVHVLLALTVIGLVLIQHGKGADAGASFGAGASQTVFGSEGSGNFLTRSTAVLAALFFVTSFALAVYAKQRAEMDTQVDIIAPVAVEQQSLISDKLPSDVEAVLPAFEDTAPTDTSDPDLPKINE